MPDAERRRLVGPGGLLRPAPIYEALEKHDTQALNYLVVGPWNHGGWSQGAGDALGPIPFDSATAQVLPRGDPGAVVRLLPQGQGRARPAGGADLRGGQQPVAALGRLAADSDSTEAARVSTSGPDRTLALSSAAGGCRTRRLRQLRLRPGASRAVPPAARSRPRTFRAARSGRTWLVEDQRFVDDRPDVLSWETRAARRGRHDRRRGDGPPLRVDDGHATPTGS